MLAQKAVTAPLDRPEVMVFEGSIENFPAGFAETGSGSNKKLVDRGLMVWLIATEDKTGSPPLVKKGKGGESNDSAAATEGRQIFLDWFEFEGPCFDSWPPASRVACVGNDAKGEPADRARSALLSFASHAWRRPVPPAEIEPLVAAFNHDFAKNHDFDTAMRQALSLIIACPDFLYLVEPAGDQPRNLNAYELAARLSYFLWASLPDDALRQAADTGRLLDKTVLTGQVRRMLADPKAHRLATHFTGQWLGVDQIGAVAVNPEYYPKFQSVTQQSMEREAGEFFWYVLSQQRSALEFLDSDYVVVDDVLARHYGLKGVTGSEFRPVKITRDDHRGGVLGMGGFMLAQSNGAQSHPVFRGKWVLSNILNTPPSPPPPNVPQLNQADANFAKLPIKEQLAFHRQNEACASCHDKLDPYGLTLENFDAIGHWRQSEMRIVSSVGESKVKPKKAKMESVPVDASANFPDGTPVNGFAELKAYLLRTKQDVFAEGLVRKLLAYALGRSLAWTDQAEVARLKGSFASSGYRLDALITEIVLSTPFRTKQPHKPNPMKTWQMDRRTFLRGTGVTLALPLLEAMNFGRAAAAAQDAQAPKRLACIFFPNGVSLPGEDHPHHEDWHWFPLGKGKDYRFTKTLESLQPLRDSLSVIGGLSHPSGRKLPGHSVSDVFLTGSKIGSDTYTNSISVDQVYADAAGLHTRLPSLPLSTTGGIGYSGRTHTLSFTREGQPIPAEDNLRRAFNRMFGGTMESEEAARAALEQKKSMLDLILSHSKQVNAKLGKADRQKMEEYLNSVREIERRVERTESWLTVPKPKVDATALNLDLTREHPTDYIRAMYDLMFLAFQTDTTRVSTYLLGTEGNDQFSDVFPKALGLSNHHALSHSTDKSEDGFKNWAQWDQFLAQQLAYFLNRLRDTKEGDGNLLDRTLIFYGCSTSSTHLARNYPLILAGGRSFGFKHGAYHQFDENKYRLADLYVTMLNALGVENQRFADSTTNLNSALLA